MNTNHRLNGWKLLLFVTFLGPFYLFLYLWDSRRSYPAVKYWAWLLLVLLFICAYLSFTLSYNPYWIRIIYLLLLLSIFGLAFIYNWIVDSKSKTREPRFRTQIYLSRGIAWMFFMGTLFWALSNLVQAINFWLIGEYIAVYFSSITNIFHIWFLVGLVYGFVYGIQGKNNYINLDIPSLIKSTLLIFLFITIHSVLILLLIIYPLQRLSVISYYPQMSAFSFYALVVIAIPLSIINFMPRASLYGLRNAIVTIIIAIPLIILHTIVLSGYTVTVDLTVASILEDKQKLSSAKKLYSKTIPYIRHDRLLAALHHRQGVLNALNQDYETALSSFKKVMADYSENFEVYKKARRYVYSFEKNKSIADMRRKILSVQHRTFEQSASCFPNSLSVILNFYEEKPVSTRKLSYSIKEGFDQGTFIWKADSFLMKNGYNLITTFWQNKETIISLLEANYPVLIYIPGHVYTLYGYDSRMEMFLTYDTAKSNRWNDTPFKDFQKIWMRGSFLMSVVVKKGDENNLKALAPQLFRYSDSYQLWQKAHISNYYEHKDNYWKDYDRRKLSETIGLDGLKINDAYFHSDGFHPFPWDSEKWHKEIFPVLKNPWATEWPIFERFIFYLLYHNEVIEAQRLISLYESHLSDEFNRAFPRLLELKLAVEIAANNQEQILSVSNKLIGISDSTKYGSYWGNYFKGRHLMERGNLKGAVQLLLPVLNNLDLDSGSSSKAFENILNILDEIYLHDPSLISPEKMTLLEVARIYHAIEPK